MQQLLFFTAPFQPKCLRNVMQGAEQGLAWRYVTTRHGHMNRIGYVKEWQKTIVGSL